MQRAGPTFLSDHTFTNFLCPPPHPTPAAVSKFELFFSALRCCRLDTLWHVQVSRKIPGHLLNCRALHARRMCTRCHFSQPPATPESRCRTHGCVGRAECAGLFADDPAAHLFTFPNKIRSGARGWRVGLEVPAFGIRILGRRILLDHDAVKSLTPPPHSLVHLPERLVK